MKCQNCGTEFEGNFCSNCGTKSTITMIYPSDNQNIKSSLINNIIDFLKKYKKILVPIVALIVIIFLICTFNVKKPSGTYSDGKMVVLIFSGENVQMNIGFNVNIPGNDYLPGLNISDITSYGTYKMSGEKIICTFESGNTDTFIYDSKKDEINVYDTMTLKKVEQ